MAYNIWATTHPTIDTDKYSAASIYSADVIVRTDWRASNAYLYHKIGNNISGYFAYYIGSWDENPSTNTPSGANHNFTTNMNISPGQGVVPFMLRMVVQKGYLDGGNGSCYISSGSVKLTGRTVVG